MGTVSRWARPKRPRDSSIVSAGQDRPGHTAAVWRRCGSRDPLSHKIPDDRHDDRGGRGLRRRGCDRHGRLPLAQASCSGASRRRARRRRGEHVPTWRALLVRVADERLHRLRITLDRQNHRPLLQTVGAAGHRGNHLSAVRQAEAHCERAVRAKADRVPLQGHVSVRLGGPKDNQLGIQLEVKAGVFWSPTPRLGQNASTSESPSGRRSRSSNNCCSSRFGPSGEYPPPSA